MLNETRVYEEFIGPASDYKSRLLLQEADQKAAELKNSFGTSNHKIPEKHYLDQIPSEKAFREDMQEWLDTEMIGKDPFGLGQVLDFHIFEEGESSVVVKFLVRNKEGEKIYVLRTRGSHDRATGEKLTNIVVVEAEAANRRNQAFAESGMQGTGIHLDTIQQGELDLKGEKHPYIILEYGKNEYEVTDETREDFYRQLGENIAIMHKVVGEGFGNIQKTPDGKFVGMDTEYSLIDSMDDDKATLVAHGLFEKEQLDTMVDTCHQAIKVDFARGTQPVRTSKDLSRSNMFLMSQRIKFFDTEVLIDHPMTGLGLAIEKNVWDLKGKSDEEKTLFENHIIQIYENTGGTVDRKMLDYCIFLVSIKRAARAIKSKREARGKQMIDFIIQREHIKNLL